MNSDRFKLTRARWCLGLAGALGVLGAPAAARGDVALGADAALNEAYRRKEAGDARGATEAFEQARALGANRQVVELELGYLDATHGNPARARAPFDAAADGPTCDASVRARAELEVLAGATSPPTVAGADSADGQRQGETALDAAYRLRAAHRLDEARSALERARAEAAPRQRVELELGYVDAERGDPLGSATHFRAAGDGPEADVAAQARRELAYAPRTLWADIYADALASRISSAEGAAGTVVPTVRARTYVRPWLGLDLHLYAYAQGTRDTASGRGTNGVPEIYADNYALFGAGARLRVWGGRIGFYAQVGPAVGLAPSLTDANHPAVAVDGRAGFDLYTETERCAPEGRVGAAFGATPCAEIYAEGGYFSRFGQNAIGFARPRGALTVLVTGPVAWQGVIEGRAAADAKHEYYNNFVEAGVGPRLRLLRPFRFDVLATANAGTFLGLHHTDPLPRSLGYTGFRVEASTYVAF
jgi:hypothetical protein